MDRRNWLTSILGLVLGIKLLPTKLPKTERIYWASISEGFEWNTILVDLKSVKSVRIARNTNDGFPDNHWREWLSTVTPRDTEGGSYPNCRFAKLGRREDELYDVYGGQ